MFDAINALRRLPQFVNANNQKDLAPPPPAAAGAAPAIASKQQAATGAGAPVQTGFDNGLSTNQQGLINININIYLGGAPGGAGEIPKPDADQSTAPEGKGLTKSPEGFPEGSVRTAGGYTIVPEGEKAAWRVYGPGQSAEDSPLTRVWGDPHVSEGDGTRWDFTKGSDFVLPDGTSIYARTTAETGQSVTAGLEIVNGRDRVSIDGINTDKPQVGEITNDGEVWLEAHAAEGRDQFILEHNEEATDVKWFRERNGNMDGLVTGAKLEGGSYEQTIDATQKPGGVNADAPVDGEAPVENGEVKDVGEAAPGVVEGEDALAAAEDPNAAGGLGDVGGELGQFMQLLQMLLQFLQQMLGGGLGNGLGGLGDAVKEEQGITQAAETERRRVVTA